MAATKNLGNAIIEGITLFIDTPDEETFASVCYNDNARLATHLASTVATIYSRPSSLFPQHFLEKRHPFGSRCYVHVMAEVTELAHHFDREIKLRLCSLVEEVSEIGIAVYSDKEDVKFVW